MAQKAEIRSNLPAKIQTTLSNFWSMSLIFSALMVLLRVVELVLIFQSHVIRIDFREVIGYSFYEDFTWILYFLGLIFIFHVINSLFSITLAKWVTRFWLVLAILVQASLLFYFNKTFLPLGKDLFAYNINDMLLTVQSSGLLNYWSIGGGIVVTVILFYLLHFANKSFNLSSKVSAALTIATYWFVIFFYFIPLNDPDKLDETKTNIQLNKSKYLSEQAFEYFMYSNEYYFDFYLRSLSEGLFVKKEYTDPNYPFLHKADYPDVLSPYFDSLSSPPDIVFVLIESLGKAYSGKDAYLGSFTPFLDSLESHSLVWTNAISSTGRTFGVLPGIFAGLPYGERGFMELNDNYPKHETMISVLQSNGYESSFYIGGDEDFDKESNFLKAQNLTRLFDQDDFGDGYDKIPSNNGFTWGYTDKALYRFGLNAFESSQEKPQLKIFQTLTSHDPYLVPERDLYSNKFETHLENYLNLSEDKKSDYRIYQNVYMTILYADDAIKDFITSYTLRPEFANTIFVFTGDHRLPEIPMSSRIDRFHVPLIIYSPLINRPTYFKGLVSHFEITPSILSFLETQVGIQLPEEEIWMGQVMDTSKVFQSKIAMPLMRNKNQLMEYLDGEYLLSDDQLFVISDGLNIDPVEDQNMKNKLTGEFEDFKNKNNYIIQTRKLLPLDD